MSGLQVVSSSGTAASRVQLMDSSGKCKAHLEGYRSRELRAGAGSEPPLPLFVTSWQPLEATASTILSRSATYYVCDSGAFLASGSSHRARPTRISHSATDEALMLVVEI